MRLSPVLVSMLAFAACMGNSMSANAQTQDKPIVLPEQDTEHQVVGVFKAIPTAKKNSVVLPTVTQREMAQVPTQAPSPVSPYEEEEQPIEPSAPQNTQPPTVQPAPNPSENQPSDRPTSPPAQTGPQNTQPPTVQPAPNPSEIQPSDRPTSPPGQTGPQNNQAPTFQPAPNPPENQPSDRPTSPPVQTPGVQPPTQSPSESSSEPRVLVSEVLVRPEAGQLASQLENEVYRVIRTQPGRTTTRSQLQQDINAIFATGFFSNVQVVPEDTALGVRVSFVVQPNPVLTKVQIQSTGDTLPSAIANENIDKIFQPQYGKILNLRELQQGIKQLVKQYQDQGYVLANVVGAPQVSDNGVVTLQVASGVIEDIRVQFRNKEGETTNDQGEPVKGRTQEYIITRELQLKPGEVFNRNIIQRDLQRVFGLGLFEDVNVALEPGEDPSKVDVIVNVVERNSGSIAAGAGISSASGLFGTISYQEQNLNGRNQNLGAELQVGQRELLYDLRFSDPWIAGDPYRTSYTVNAFRRRSISLIFDGDDAEIETIDPNNPNSDEDGDRPRVVRFGGGVNFARPLSKNPYAKSEWNASAGLQYQRISIRDDDGDTRARGRVFCNDDTPSGVDCDNSIPLSASGDGKDDLLLVRLGAYRDLRNNPLQPTSGSFLRLGVDQSVPVGQGSILLTRLRGSYSQYVPVNFTNFAKGPETLAFNVQAGTILGDLPPYEAFSIGGSNSVRGYDEGALGTGRSYLEASAEYRFPLFSVISGAVFFDVGSDLGTATDAAELLDKNGFGFGYGLGVRVQSPLGPIRIDYGLNDDGDSRINFGIGERF